MLEVVRISIDAGASAAIVRPIFRPQIAIALPPLWRKSAAVVHRQSARPVAGWRAVVPVIDTAVQELATRAERAGDADAGDRLRLASRQLPRDIIRERFAERTRLLLDYRGEKQRVIAERMGLDPEKGHKTVSRYRHADGPSGRFPEPVELVAFAEALGVSTGFFLDADPPELEQLQNGTL